jgi:hypothetical protein
VSVVLNRRPQRWLNIVLDINGILCETARAYAFPRGSGNPTAFSCTVPACIGPKSVYTRPGVRAFLADISSISNSIIVWSSMRKSTVVEIAKYLFSDIPSPAFVLGQESCDRIETSPNKFLMDQDNSEKTIFLKTLSSSLFGRQVDSVVLNSDNTLLIDDSPEKSVCNHSGNAIFLRSWKRAASDDKFLTEELVPWLRRLNSDCPMGQMQDYVNMNRIGIQPLAPSSPRMKYIIDGMRLSSRNVGLVYEIPNVYSSTSR